MFPTTNYTLTWPQNDPLPICCPNTPTLHTIVKDECQNKESITISAALKSKKRIEKSIEKEVLSAKKNS